MLSVRTGWKVPALTCCVTAARRECKNAKELPVATVV
jgi:hypothetical protein